jgi:hypothetical protein
VNISGATGFVVVGDPGDDGCAANVLRSTLTLTDNTAGVEVGHNSRIGSVTLKGNAGSVWADDASPEVEANTIVGSLSCSGNTPAAINDGQPNTVSGRRSGECAQL